MRIEQSSPPARAARTQVDRPATMRDPARAPIDVVLRNLSTTGALLEADEALPVGTLVSLGIAGAGIHIGRIARLTPSGMATEFMVSLDPAAVARAKTSETIISIAFPQIAVQHPSTSVLQAVQSSRSSTRPAVETRRATAAVRHDEGTDAPPRAAWGAVAAILVVLLVFLLL